MEAMLKELTVLDFTNNIAGPCAGVLLADQGANVIHVESPCGETTAGISPR